SGSFGGLPVVSGAESECDSSLTMRSLCSSWRAPDDKDELLHKLIDHRDLGRHRDDGGAERAVERLPRRGPFGLLVGDRFLDFDDSGRERRGALHDGGVVALRHRVLRGGQRGINLRWAGTYLTASGLPGAHAVSAAS